MNYYNQDSLRLATRERLEQRVREAEAERLAREINRNTRARVRRPLTFWHVRVTGHRASKPRLET